MNNIIESAKTYASVAILAGVAAIPATIIIAAAPIVSAVAVPIFALKALHN